MKTPLRNTIAATLAIVVMILLGAVAIRALTLKPDTIVNTERIVLPNDSLITLREELAAAEARAGVLQVIAEDRYRTIQNLTSPLSNISDSLIALQRNIEAGNAAQRIAVDRDRLDRADRFQALKESSDRVATSQASMPHYFTQLEQTIASALSRPPDTLAIEPRRRGFFARLFSRS